MPVKVTAKVPLRWRTAYSGVYEQHRAAKQKRYVDRIGAGYAGIRLIAEGDSWLELPWPIYRSDMIQVLERDWPVFSLARAGDAWSDILAKNELVPTVRTLVRRGLGPHAALLSIGGNDVLGEIERFVLPFRAGTSSAPERLIDVPELRRVIDPAIANTAALCRALVDEDLDVILHGYGRCDPRPPRPEAGSGMRSGGGNFIGGPLQDQRRIAGVGNWRRIVDAMLEPFNAGLAAVAARPEMQGRVHYCDLRPQIPCGAGHWQDEVHPNETGFLAAVVPIKAAVERIRKARGLPPR